jgi:hypothetical protein
MNIKNPNVVSLYQMKTVTQECILCKTQVSRKIFYQWSDPTDNIYGFHHIKSHYRIYGLQSSQYPVKIYIDVDKNVYCYLYYNVLCVDCAKTYDNKWKCLYCNKYYDDTVTHCKNRMCQYCIEKGVTYI